MDGRRYGKCSQNVDSKDLLEIRPNTHQVYLRGYSADSAHNETTNTTFDSTEVYNTNYGIGMLSNIDVEKFENNESQNLYLVTKRVRKKKRSVLEPFLCEPT